MSEPGGDFAFRAVGRGGDFGVGQAVGPAERQQKAVCGRDEAFGALFVFFIVFQFSFTILVWRWSVVSLRFGLAVGIRSDALKRRFSTFFVFRFDLRVNLRRLRRLYKLYANAQRRLFR